MNDDETKWRNAAGETQVRSNPAPEETQVRAEPTLQRSPPPSGSDTHERDVGVEMSATAVREPVGATEAGRGVAGAPLREGDKVRGRFLLEELIGKGAMGQVWRAKDLLAVEARDRTPHVALKLLNSDFERHRDAFTALYREASRAQKLAHPNIVTVQICDRDDFTGRAFIVMELLDGQPLDHVIRKAGPNGLPAAEAL